MKSAPTESDRRSAQNSLAAPFLQCLSIEWLLGCQRGDWFHRFPGYLGPFKQKKNAATKDLVINFSGSAKKPLARSFLPCYFRVHIVYLAVTQQHFSDHLPIRVVAAIPLLMI
jgi:hypothetical protein